MKSRGWVLFRVLFPSWRFFEDLDWVPQVRYRLLSDPTEGAPRSEWLIGIPLERRGLGSLFLNARGNLRMAAQSLVELFSSDLTEIPEGEGLGHAILDSVSYRLMVRLVRFRIRESRLSGFTHFQFKLVSILPGLTEDESTEELFLSAIHEVTEPEVEE